ncbi:FAD-dependent oxidoreductase [Corynebacterium aquilae]|uniref:FAD-dependent oxidoreductase n=1 Tax=Corynebacterium aquilae TaxID=203263 RepID=UPI000B0A873D|nr:FAD-dependent oxidoreductase [Corynebacterium aquilae]
MSTQQFDVVVVGFGKAGKTIAMKRAKAGDKVALIERDPRMFGGTCINIGCVPTKKLLTEMAAFELVGGDKDQGFATAVERRNALIEKMNAANKGMADNAGVTVIVGEARFVGAHTVQVTGGEDELKISGETIIINTGATPVWPPIPGIDGERIFNSTQIQQIERPQHLVVVGGGPIGLEFATLFSGFGSQVTVLDAADRPLARFDEDVAAMAAELMEKRGVTFINGAQVTEFVEDADQVTVRYEGGEVTADAVLVAIGRKPATAGLGLEEAGIELNERGAVKVDEHLRTTAEGVYAAGDVNGGPQFTYISFDDHRIILADKWGVGKLHSTKDRVIPTTTFLEPPLSTVGVSRADVAERIDAGEVVERVVKIAEVPILPRPKILGQPEGMARLIVEKESDKILGATLFCIDSQELINTVALAMRHDVTATELAEGIYTHPATSEVFNALG